jgi:hypothetical protein
MFTFYLTGERGFSALTIINDIATIYYYEITRPSEHLSVRLTSDEARALERCIRRYIREQNLLGQNLISSIGQKDRTHSSLHSLVEEFDLGHFHIKYNKPIDSSILSKIFDFLEECGVAELPAGKKMFSNTDKKNILQEFNVYKNSQNEEKEHFSSNSSIYKELYKRKKLPTIAEHTQCLGNTKFGACTLENSYTPKRLLPELKAIDNSAYQQPTFNTLAAIIVGSIFFVLIYFLMKRKTRGVRPEEQAQPPKLDYS